MPTAIYLGNDRIQIVTGKLKKRGLLAVKAYSEAIPEGTIINGIITNEPWLKNRLLELKAEHRLGRGKLELVVDSGDILVKTAVVPILRERQLKKLVPGEFTEAAAGHHDMLYDYSVLRPKNDEDEGATILCTAAQRALIESYIDLFTGVNKNLGSIRLGLDCVLRLCAATPELALQTCVLLLLDGTTLVSTLLVNGQYFFSQRNRLLQERGSHDSALELNQRLSYIAQFNKSQNSGGVITHVYLGGLGEKEGTLTATLEELCGYTVGPLPGESLIRSGSDPGFLLSDYVYCAGGLL